MSTELVYRLRTCAAAIAASADNGNPWDVTLIAHDAADLLVEAANVIETTAAPLGELMEVISVAALADRVGNPGVAVWGDQLKATPQPCSACGDIGSARTVHRFGRKLMLTCPRCSNTWEYGKNGA